MVPMVGLAYFPLLLWLPLLAVQCLGVIYLGSSGQGAVRSISGLLVDTALNGLLKIVWVVMLVLCLDCLRGAFKPSNPAADGVQSAQMFEAYAAKEGALVLALNLACMMAIQSLHVITGKCIKLELDRDIMKRQAEQQGQFSKQLMASEEKKAKNAVPPETKMEEKADEKEAEGELRKRD
eukprot:CAMPEP_0197650938 /NCGR_PEP_ID=MMETSP1338-20131121/31252_1 /TAXON_ID=43686 ORGANISM="Pelagodinium beii, Strain RCC1491" /NCGR_SAMPLE_ID=MMETSP1338 /ASSEMBLY_ACC=CAM_ASM_000754 /LENGTH=179 /DNA_ID=CAMNT_0043225457 /DNA_START=25 /DNA_END=564 /DNA_ORIENTATION=+